MSARVALVAGANGGIGAACVRALAAGGVTVVGTDLTEAPVPGVSAALARYHQADIAAPGACDAVVQELLGEFDRLDIAVNAAGISEVQGFLDVHLEAWESIFRTNVTGSLLLGQAAARAMLSGRRGGRIIFLASILGLVPRLGNTTYCASKAAVLHLMRCMALELAGDAITVNAVCPGPTLTPMLTEVQAGGDDQTLDKIVKGDLASWRLGIPIGRLGWPDDQAATVRFLASEEASYITGQALCVDGGQTLVA